MNDPTFPTKHRHSSVQKFLDCQQSYFYAYVEGLQPLREDTRMSIGTLVHAGIEAAFRNQSLYGASVGDAEFHRALRSGIESAVRDEMVLEDGEAELAFEIVINALDTMKFWEWEPIMVYENAPLCDGNGTPAIELEIIIPRQYSSIGGKLDLVAKHKPTGQIFIIDHKCRSKFYSEEAEECSSQFGHYAWLLRTKYGIKIDGRITMQIKPYVPEPPKQNKDGSLSRAANSKTTWEVYLQTLEALGLDPEDYSDMQEKLAGNEFLRMTKTLANSTEVANLAANFQNAVAQIERVAQAGWDTAVRNLRPHYCVRCPYRVLCLEGLRDGDTDFIADTQFRRGSLPIVHDIVMEVDDND